MKTTPTIIICAILSLSIGIAAAAPLMISELNITPFPRIPEGPKADFEVNTVYANFDVNKHASNLVSGGIHLSTVDYEIVFNITNHSEFPARIGNIILTAAENISITPSIAGGFSATAGGGKSGSISNNFIEGIWLDNQWLNVTWLPDGEWPMLPGGTSLNNIPTTIPDLPENATQTGKWIEGVHFCEWHNQTTTKTGTTITKADYIFVNGTWVDVTGRVRVDNEQPYVDAVNTLVHNILNFDSENYGNYANKTEFDAAMTQRNNSSSFGSMIIDVWAGKEGFDNYWQPHESRLIVLTGTVNVGGNAGLESLDEGRITLFTAINSYLRDREELQTVFENTFAVATELKEVQVQKTANTYLYNNILGANQAFQTDQFGVEAFIIPRS
ncbi:MAG: hypothetical protein ACFCUE_09940 [Candidatus Bathyarchaeia archaeon]|jgi:hypothetical protein